MCGIAALAGSFDDGELDRLTEALRHRGPDESGAFHDPAGVALATCRLAILDLEGGHQPMANADGSVRIVFNGEIFNMPELRERLAREGYPFQTSRSDTEVVLALYETRPDDFLDELNGMFAFVIWDAPRRRL